MYLWPWKRPTLPRLCGAGSLRRHSREMFGGRLRLYTVRAADRDDPRKPDVYYSELESDFMTQNCRFCSAKLDLKWELAHGQCIGCLKWLEQMGRGERAVVELLVRMRNADLKSQERGKA